MGYKVLSPAQSISSIYRKQNIGETRFLNFVSQLAALQKNINPDESEEHLKVPLRDFLKNTFYKDYEINTSKRVDFAIYNGKSDKAPMAVLVEIKKPANKNEMPTKDNLSAKAVYESILYYLRQRIDFKNNDIKHIIITNLYEWFVFDANQYEKYFYQNNKLIKEYKAWSEGQKTSSNTDLFYKEIAPKYLPDENIEFTHFSINDYNTQKETEELKTDKTLTALYKFFSLEHLLKKPFANDSNSLNKPFYYELLYILGLEEHKEKGKKLISRPPEGKRINGSMIENTITTIQSRNRLQHLKKARNYGVTESEQLEAVALEVNISWLNRILFLKLLEAQLIRYHNGNEDYRFLSFDKINEYDMLEELFFDVLAVQEDMRNPYSKENFGHIPYLNSSLFEQTEIEDNVVSMSMLKDRHKIPLYKNTVLKNAKGKKQEGEMPILEYMFAFLDAYNFASEGNEEIQKHSKELINASVLGLIFEKINGYKEGSFFTPGFITEYMARETIRRAVVQKFKDPNLEELKKYGDVNELQGLKAINEFEDVKFFMKRFLNKDYIKLFNAVINSLKIVDPAVGSGHFLVSVLNEILTIKSELGLLADEEGMPLDYSVIIENDELVIKHRLTDELFEYHLNTKDEPIEELQRTQQTLFNEKRKIIENCLFGVDINPNSVNITRLRLWIELLKNAYYRPVVETHDRVSLQLETLPNIDINIKTGNSLISRFALDIDIKKALRGTKWNMFSYLNAVKSYKSTYDKEAKDKIRQIIKDIKDSFRTELRTRDPRYVRLNKLKNKFYDLFSSNMLFEPEAQYGKNKSEEKKRTGKKKEMQKDIDKLAAEIEEIKNSKIYNNAFEWRFEFPEVLDDNGKFLGFDVVIGNPPYINLVNLSAYLRNYYKSNELFKNKTDLYAFFVGQAHKIKNKNGFTCFIIPHTWISTTSFLPLREFLINSLFIDKIVELDFGVFKEATVKTVIIQTSNNKKKYVKLLDENFKFKNDIPISIIKQDNELKINLTWNKEKQLIFDKIKKDSTLLGEIIHFSRGIKTSNDTRFIFREKKNNEYFKLIRGRNIKAYRIDYDNEYIWYRPDLMREKVGCLPHTKELFLESQKIITQRVNSSGQLLVTYDNEKYFCLDTTNVSSEIIDKSYNLKFIVGVMNSKLINWWFNDIFKNPTISGYELKQIPIKRTIKLENYIQNKVTQIITAKKENPQADTSTLEKEIDQMVYELYGLTKEEIKIVENAL